MTHITRYVATGIVFTITTIVLLRVSQVAIDRKSLATVRYPLPPPPPSPPPFFPLVWSLTTNNVYSLKQFIWCERVDYNTNSWCSLGGKLILCLHSQHSQRSYRQPPQCGSCLPLRTM